MASVPRDPTTPLEAENTDKSCAVCSKLTDNPHHHHTLRNEPPYNEREEGSDYTGHWRNNPLYRQWLCEEHHLSDAHELFEATGKWPEGFGTADKPFRRGDPDVERIIDEARAAAKQVKDDAAAG